MCILIVFSRIKFIVYILEIYEEMGMNLLLFTWKHESYFEVGIQVRIKTLPNLQVRLIWPRILNKS